MTEKLSVGDHVQWNTPQGKTQGRIEKKLTKHTQVEGHNVAASEDEPQFLVKSDKTGKRAAHKPDALERIKS